MKFIQDSFSSNTILRRLLVCFLVIIVYGWRAYMKRG